MYLTIQVTIAIVVVMIVGTFLRNEAKVLNDTTFTIAAIYTDGEDEWRIDTLSDDVYVNHKSLFNWKFDTVDLQTRFEIGETYTCKVNSLYYGMLVNRRNIISCE